MLKEVLAGLSRPDPEYRGAPFWSWNSKLDPQELRRQVGIFRKMGFGGFFIHSRLGLSTPYLSDEWMECVRLTIEEAAKQGLRVWLYDEDRWPSGFAGGLVTRDPAYRARKLVLDLVKPPASFFWNDAVAAAFVARIKGKRLQTYRRIDAGSVPRIAAGETLLVFRIEIAPDSSWFNGSAYLDTMNPKAVRRFMDLTHERYAQRFASAFGGTVSGIFTDEPNVAEYTDVSLPWTDALPRQFSRRFSYDVLDRLPEVLFETDTGESGLVSPVARDLHDCTTALFVESFARQIGRWCSDHNLSLTGHVLAEETLSTQSRLVGAAMRFYEYMQVPGIDVLTEHNREYDTAKQMSSIAHQLGARWRLSETYGATGWNFSWKAQKAVGDWQAALGVNLRCHHLASYSTAGESKRDYPPSLFFQSPWWESYGKVEDYFARINLFMSHGVEVRDILVVHPIESAWALPTRSGAERDRLDAAHRELRDALLAANLDFDYGDEDVLSRMGLVDATSDAPRLVVGQAGYTTVVIPALLTIRKSTFDLLTGFADAGGSVVFLADPPSYVDCRRSDEAAVLAQRCACADGDLSVLTGLAGKTGRRVSIADAKGAELLPTLYCLREDVDAYYLFICNTGHESFGPPVLYEPVSERKASFEEVVVKVRGDGAGSPFEIDLDTGCGYRADELEPLGEEGTSRDLGRQRLSAFRWAVRTNLPELGSRMFVFPKEERGSPQSRGAVLSFERRVAMADMRRVVPDPGSWRYELSEPNVFVLDRPDSWSMSVPGREGEPAPDHAAERQGDDILRIDDQIRATLGLELRRDGMKQPWVWDATTEGELSADIVLKYYFDAQVLPSAPLFLALEQPELYTVELNERAIALDDRGYWVDPSLRRIEIPVSLVREGRNRLRLTCSYDRRHAGLEALFLLGKFGVKIDGAMTALADLPDCLRFGDWTKQRLPFYSGNVRLFTELTELPSGDERLVVRVDDFEGTALRILVNGNEAGIVAWKPYEVDITEALRRRPDGPSAEATPSSDGRDNNAAWTLGIELLGHRRNSFGPLHCTPPYVRSCGPREFRVPPYDPAHPDFMKARGWWTDGESLVRFGVASPPELIVRRPAR